MVTYFNNNDREKLLLLKSYLVSNNLNSDILEIEDNKHIEFIEQLFEDRKNDRIIVSIRIQDSNYKTPLLISSDGIKHIVERTKNGIQFKVRKWLLEYVD